MAARAGLIGKRGGNPEIVDLRTVAARELEPVLSDEIREWQSELNWDFEPSAELVRQYAASSSLGGAALMVDGEVAGYGYAVVEEPRGIIGDVYVRPRLRTPRFEADLFQSILEALATTPHVTRMESQLMLAGAEAAEVIRAESAARGRPVRIFERRLMWREAGAPLDAAPGDAAGSFRLEPWEQRYLHAAGGIIAGAYQGEPDSEINVQYRSPSGARRFLSNIVEFPGCGIFDAGASFIAFDRNTGAAAGMALSSFIAGGSGHISQLCVMPEARGRGLGRELLREASAALHRNGARRVSLTVTASNRTAVSLYEKSGFRDIRRFFAYIQES